MIDDQPGCVADTGSSAERMNRSGHNMLWTKDRCTGRNN